MLNKWRNLRSSQILFYDGFLMIWWNLIIMDYIIFLVWMALSELLAEVNKLLNWTWSRVMWKRNTHVDMNGTRSVQKASERFNLTSKLQWAVMVRWPISIDHLCFHVYHVPNSAYANITSIFFSSLDLDRCEKNMSIDQSVMISWCDGSTHWRYWIDLLVGLLDTI